MSVATGVVIDDALVVDNVVDDGYELDDADGWSVVDAGVGSDVDVLLL